MNPPGADSPLGRQDLLVAARAALLDALEALEGHRDAVVVIGAQAIYLRATASPVALAEATKDSDLAIDPRVLANEPLIEDVMMRARFYPNAISGQPGAWMNPAGIPVDLMVPEGVAGPGGPTTRGARIPPHSRRATRRAAGLEAALIDYDEIEVSALDAADGRAYRVRVAGLAALLVAKLHKIGERAHSTPDRLIDKDAHDLYRILVAAATEPLATTLNALAGDDIAGDATQTAIGFLRELFAAGPDATGSVMAGRADEGVGDPALVSESVAILAADLVAALEGRP